MENVVVHNEKPSVEEVLSLIDDGSFFGVTFVKKDGSLRKMNARRGVRKYVKGKGMKYDPYEKGLIPVWEYKSHDDEHPGYRMVNVNTIREIKTHGVRHVFP